MKITKETIEATIQIMKADHHTKQEIEDSFKAALKKKLISLDDYCTAIEKIYE